MELVPAQIPPEQMPSMEAALTAAWAFKKKRDGERDKAAVDGLESPAARFLRRLHAHDGPNENFRTVHIHDDETGEETTWHVKQLNASEFKKIGLSIARTGLTLLDLDDTALYDALYPALLFYGVWDKEPVARPFFADEAEALEFWETPGRASVIALRLTELVIDLNPFPPDVKKAWGSAARESGAPA